MFDPFLTDNPVADIGADQVRQLDYILCSHGHFDHFGDAIALAKRTGAAIVGVYELVSFAQAQGVKNGHGMNVGGGASFPFGRVKLTPALHSGTVHGDDEGRYGRAHDAPRGEDVAEGPGEPRRGPLPLAADPHGDGDDDPISRGHRRVAEPIVEVALDLCLPDHSTPPPVGARRASASSAARIASWALYNRDRAVPCGMPSASAISAAE